MQGCPILVFFLAHLKKTKTKTTSEKKPSTKATKSKPDTKKVSKK